MNPNDKNIIVDTELKEQLKALVLERVSVMPDTLCVAVGGIEFKKQDLVFHIKEEDEIGKQMIEMELSFLRDLASGAVYAHE